MSTRIPIGVGLLALLLAACGGAGPAASPPPAPDQSAPAPDGGAVAPEGQIVIQVDGRTFSAPITECRVEENNFLALARDPDANVSLEARASDIGAGWTVSASVTQNDLAFNAVSRTATPTITGRSLTVTVDFGRRGGDLPDGEVGPGQVSATCPVGGG